MFTIILYILGGLIALIIVIALVLTIVFRYRLNQKINVYFDIGDCYKIAYSFEALRLEKYYRNLLIDFDYHRYNPERFYYGLRINLIFVALYFDANVEQVHE